MITKTGHIEVEGGHLVMNPEVSQDSVPGQVLDSKQVSVISTDGAGGGFQCSSDKSNSMCASSSGPDCLQCS